MRGNINNNNNNHDIFLVKSYVILLCLSILALENRCTAPLPHLQKSSSQGRVKVKDSGSWVTGSLPESQKCCLPSAVISRNLRSGRFYQLLFMHRQVTGFLFSAPRLDRVSRNSYPIINPIFYPIFCPIASRIPLITCFKLIFHISNPFQLILALDNTERVFFSTGPVALTQISNFGISHHIAGHLRRSAIAPQFKLSAGAISFARCPLLKG